MLRADVSQVRLGRTSIRFRVLHEFPISPGFPPDGATTQLEREKHDVGSTL